MYLKISKNKNLEIEFLTHTEWSWFDFSLRFNRKCDHAGFTFSAELVGFEFNFNIYDSRHWNYKENRWNTENDYVEDKCICDVELDSDEQTRHVAAVNSFFEDKKDPHSISQVVSLTNFRNTMQPVRIIDLLGDKVVSIKPAEIVQCIISMPDSDHVSVSLLDGSITISHISLIHKKMNEQHGN